MTNENVEKELVGEILINKFPKRKIWGIFLMGIGMYFVMRAFAFLFVSGTAVFMEEFSWVRIIIYLASMVLVIPLHELLHGIMFKIYTGKMTFGVKLKTKFGPVFYASSIGSLLTINQYRLVALTPQALTLVIIIFISLMKGIIPDAAIIMLYSIACLNVLGGCLDIYLVFRFSKYDKNYLVEDTKDGCKIYKKL